MVLSCFSFMTVTMKQASAGIRPLSITHLKKRTTLCRSIFSTGIIRVICSYYLYYIFFSDNYKNSFYKKTSLPDIRQRVFLSALSAVFSLLFQITVKLIIHFFHSFYKDISVFHYIFSFQRIHVSYLCAVIAYQKHIMVFCRLCKHRYLFSDII